MAEKRNGLIIKVSARISTVYPGANEMYFGIHLGSNKPDKGHIFVPLATKQRTRLEQYNAKYPDNEYPNYLGHAQVDLTPSDKKAVFCAFFPFRVDTKELRGRRPNPRRLGIGSLIHYAITEYLARKKWLDGYEITHDPLGVTESRRRQLRRMGISHFKAYNFPEYRKIVRRAVVKRFGTLPQLEMP